MSDQTHDPMPVFVLKGKDALAPGIIDAYRRECARHGLDDQAGQVEFAFREMADWQARNWTLVKLPDHLHVPVTESQVDADTAVSEYELRSARAVVNLACSEDDPAPAEEVTR